MYPSPQFRNTVLIFICLPGFRLVGRSTLYCDGRQWSSLPPVCVEQPSTTSSVLLHSSAASTSTSDDAVTHTQPLSSQSFTSRSDFPVSPFDVLPTRELSHAPATLTSASSTRSRYLPTSFSTPSSLDSSVAGTSTPVGPDDVVYTPVFTHYQANTGVTLPSLYATTAKTQPRVTSSRLVPMWQLSTLSNIGNVTLSKSHDSVSTFFGGFQSTRTSSVQSRRITSLPAIVSSTHERSSHRLQPGTASLMTDMLLTNGTGKVRALESSEEEHDGRTLLWYATVAGSCVVVLAVAGVTCGVVVHRRAPTFRRYQMMDGDEMQSIAAAETAAVGRSVFYATPYTQLTSSYFNDEQRRSSPQTQNDGYSFV